MGQILEIIEAVSCQEDVEKETIFAAIEDALLGMAKKKLPDQKIAVEVDRKTGFYRLFNYLNVVSNDDFSGDSTTEISEREAAEIAPGSQVGDEVKIMLEDLKFGRIDIQVLRRKIAQGVSEAIKDRTEETYRAKVGQVMTGTVQKFGRDFIIVLLPSSKEAILPQKFSIPREIFHLGSRIKVYLQEVRRDERDVRLILSRIHPQLLVELFKIEVPEIHEEIIQIKGVAREPGIRGKISIKTNDKRIDAIGACIGMRGARVQAISNELNGERIDIALWDSDPLKFLINIMSPIEIRSVSLDEEQQTMDIGVEQTNLAQAIGKNGQNIRLASELLGWNLNIMSMEEFSQRTQSDRDGIKTLFTAKLDIDEEIAEILIREGFRTLEQIACVDSKEIQSISEFDQEIAKTLQQRAAEELRIVRSATKIDDSLIGIANMTDEIAIILTQKGVTNQERLAELAADEISDLTGLDLEKSKEMVMSARQIWFK